MIFLQVILLSGTLMTFMGGLQGLHCDENCADKPVFTPSSLIVEYNSQASVRCTACQDACKREQTGLQVSHGQPKKDGVLILWKVENMTDYGLSPICYYTKDDGNSCCSRLPVTVYKPPSYVFLDLMKEIGETPEEDQYTVWCTVVQVAPIENVMVTFYREHNGFVVTMGQVKSKKTGETQASDTFVLDVNTLEDHESTYWCEAKLELGAEGPQPPLVFVSGKKDHTMMSLLASSTKLVNSFSLCSILLMFSLT